MKIQIKALAVMLAMMLSGSFVFSTGHAEDKNAINKNEKKVKLTVQSVVEYLLSNNYDVKKALLEYKGLGTDLMSFKSKYDPRLIGNGTYSYSKTANQAMTPLYGESTTSANMYAGVSKSFSTGTTVSGGLTTRYEKIPGKMSFSTIDPGPEGYESSIKVELSQELMKNCFGMIDRMTEKKLCNAEWMRKQSVRMKLAGLLVEAIIGFWNVAIADENLITIKLQLESTKNIKNLYQRKLKIGLAEREELLEWDSRVIDSISSVDLGGKKLFDAKLEVLRILDLDPDMEIILGKTFTTDKPDVAFEEAIKDAFIKRVDWNSQKINMKNAELEYKIATNNLLPSLKLKGSFGNKDYDNESWDKSFDDFNEEYSVGVEFNYPLGDRGGDAKMRTARLGLQQQYLETKNMEKEIRDNVLSFIKQCDVTYKVYIQTQKSSELKRQYYEQVLRNFNRGQYNALKIKQALDDYIQSRHNVLVSKVEYNKALLLRDLGRNVVFEKLGIDIDAILKRVDN